MTDSNNNKILLDNIPKTNPFKVPEEYFNELQNRISDKIKSEPLAKEHKSVIITLKPKVAGALILAVAAAIIFGLFLFYPQTKNEPISASELAEIYKFSAISETSDAYLINQLEMTIAENEKLETNSTVDDFGSEAIDYLTKENIDLNTLLDAL